MATTVWERWAGAARDAAGADPEATGAARDAAGAARDAAGAASARARKTRQPAVVERGASCGLLFAIAVETMIRGAAGARRLQIRSGRAEARPCGAPEGRGRRPRRRGPTAGTVARPR